MHSQYSDQTDETPRVSELLKVDCDLEAVAKALRTDLKAQASFTRGAARKGWPPMAHKARQDNGSGERGESSHQRPRDMVVVRLSVGIRHKARQRATTTARAAKIDPVDVTGTVHGIST